jgi:hypothetical protein
VIFIDPDFILDPNRENAKTSQKSEKFNTGTVPILNAFKFHEKPRTGTDI